MIFFLVNGVLHLFHLLMIFASVFLWLWPRALAPHLFLQILILCSWFGLGAAKRQLGYCLITDLQRRWQIRHGRDFPSSYMVYLYRRAGLGRWPEKRINQITFGVFIGTTLVSVVLWVRGWAAS